MYNVKSMLIVAIASVSLMACNQTKSNDKGVVAEQQASKTSQSSVSKEDAQKILSNYLKIKNALVKTDGEAASSTAKNMLGLLTSKDELVGKIKIDIEHIIDTNDPSKQRDHFNTLSDNVYDLIKSTSANERAIYRQFCPMAMNNKGAYWLSAEKEVNNPYFGDMMLHCGSVKEEL
jgi:hypothetical protein